MALLDVFHAMHPSSAYELLADCYVGDIEPTAAEEQDEKQASSAAFAEEMRELRDKLKAEGYFDANPVYYTYKVLSTLALCGLAFAILYAWGQTSTTLVVISALLVGLFWQQCGWLAHDFAHHQCFQDRQLNDAMVVFLGNFCQGFSLSW